MKKKLEDFIVQNRPEMDALEPSSELWAKIASKLDEKPKKEKTFKLSMWIGVAASVVLVFGLWMFSNNIPVSDAEIVGVDPEYVEKKVQFASLIEEKRDSLARFEDVNPELTREFSQDLLLLDEEYEKLTSEMNTTPNRETIVKAMIRNREMQLQTLRQQLMILNQVSDLKNRNNSNL